MMSGNDCLNKKRFSSRREGGQWACRNDVSWQCIPDVWSRNHKRSAADWWLKLTAMSSLQNALKYIMYIMIH